MIFDRTLLLSNAQAVTASAASSDVIDLGVTGTVFGAGSSLTRDIGKGQDVPFLFQVVEDFNTLTSLKIAIEVDDNAGFTTPTEVASQTIPLARLKAGTQFNINTIPEGTNERYMRAFYTVTGTAPTLGRITAGAVAGVQTNTNA